jgi:hypothetical protein
MTAFATNETKIVDQQALRTLRDTGQNSPLKSTSPAATATRVVKTTSFLPKELSWLLDTPLPLQNGSAKLLGIYPLRSGEGD